MYMYMLLLYKHNHMSVVLPSTFSQQCLSRLYERHTWILSLACTCTCTLCTEAVCMTCPANIQFWRTLFEFVHSPLISAPLRVHTASVYMYKMYLPFLAVSTQFLPSKQHVHGTWNHAGNRARARCTSLILAVSTHR